MKAKMTIMQQMIDNLTSRGKYRVVDDENKKLTGDYFYKVEMLPNNYVLYQMVKNGKIFSNVVDASMFNSQMSRQKFLNACVYSNVIYFGDYIVLFNDNSMKIMDKFGSETLKNTKVYVANERFVIFASGLDLLSPCKFMYLENGRVMAETLKEISQAKIEFIKFFGFNKFTVEHLCKKEEVDEFLHMLKLILDEDERNFNKNSKKCYVEHSLNTKFSTTKYAKRADIEVDTDYIYNQFKNLCNARLEELSKSKETKI